MSTLFGWISGVATTTAGAWISGRFHNYEQERKEHRDDLKEEVLQPLRLGLVKYFTPKLCGQAPILLTEHAATGFNFDASVTDAPEKYGPVLIAKFPSAFVFGQIDSALLHDARATSNWPGAANSGSTLTGRIRLLLCSSNAPVEFDTAQTLPN